MTSNALKVFISDLHGELDVFDFLADRQFGILHLLIRQQFSPELNETLCAAIEASAIRLCRAANASQAQLDRTSAVSKEILFTALFLMVVQQKAEDESLTIAIRRWGWLSTVHRALSGDAQLSCTPFSQLVEMLAQNIRTLSAQDFFALVQAFAKALFKKLSPELNIVGDIYDRGQDAFAIMERLRGLPNVAIQWGNHDVVWMGAASGNLACITVAVRICLRYGTLDMLHRDYGINLSRLERFAAKAYGDDDCAQFTPKGDLNAEEKLRIARMHKAISIIQFKLEGKLIARRPEYTMADRLLLDKINIANSTVTVGDAVHPLLDSNFPTLDVEQPYRLSEDERKVAEDLKQQFLASAKLTQHMDILFHRGGMQKKTGDWLLYHACVPVDEQGEFQPFALAPETTRGQSLFNFCELEMRRGYLNRMVINDRNESDIAWFLWCGPHSPLFGKARMTTFERYFVADKQTHKEGKNEYYNLRSNPEFLARVATELKCSSDQVRIVNGHVPVKYQSGERPVQANGKLFSIDGGFSMPYRSATGLAGFVLLEALGQIVLYRVIPNDKRYALEVEYQQILKPKAASVPAA
ncbi:fructose-bisphosphatase class III [Saccharophagus degradans]|uniref:Fructose-1,6-bisphosphatase class 3 n=1 Tax=Saccharophagus degradans (strain 2-40 / ATCC 43961 / DSM 17024) TaxID=203122 RepID=F16PC_SACD2|nr:fructose-bisphosphatase class III [Saccharophagus degradans]Q21FJ6.1 RecName: Full=Fructose-1,6-bisphosphatase class 3; Short=FBPase class 3; AltName: Full=D-fructose-1,6-bisphosphate 1-phosphohydrolase class 3 [Saccharophagus degradans 2-40]ABD82533.1 fructose-1,6-bisphosphatase [Saccharophagus degradans 2-40]